MYEKDCYGRWNDMVRNVDTYQTFLSRRRMVVARLKKNIAASDGLEMYG